MNLIERIRSLAPQIAVAAQTVVDEWQQDNEGVDEELGSGGVCDKISDAISVAISEAMSDVEFTNGGHEGDDHAFLIVYDSSEACSVDIPSNVYETGGGYHWTKIKGATITASDVVVTKVDRELVLDW